MSFRLKTILGIGLIEAFILLIIVGNSLSFLRDMTHNELQKRAETAAALFATTTKNAVLSSDLASLDSFVEDALSNPDLEYARVLRNNIVLAERGNPDLLKKPFVPDMDYETVTDQVFDTFSEIREGGALYGRVEIGLSIASQMQILSDARRSTWSIAFFELVLSALFSFILGLFLTHRVNELEQAARKIAKGERDVKVTESGNDEMSRLAKAFNLMSYNLREASHKIYQHQQQLELTNQNLEHLVAERTQRLQEKNNILEKTMRMLDEERAKQLRSAFYAGISENAIGVLHNIGNSITPAFAHIKLVHKQLTETKITHYLKELHRNIQHHLTTGDLDAFLINDSRGSQYMTFFNEIILQQEQILENTKLHLDHLEQNLGHVAEMINIQQRYAKMDIPFESVKIPQLIKDVHSMYDWEFQKHEIQFEFIMAEDLPLLECHRNKLVQVLLNLFKNALESIQRQINAFPDCERKIILEVTMDVDALRFVLLDTGYGADDKVKAEMFKFGFSTKERNSGFGMHDFANFVQSHHGSLEFSSDGTGKGAQIMFTLPVHQDMFDKTASFCEWSPDGVPHILDMTRNYSNFNN
ncbi:MAG: HAMP domain-containing protein [SAR324 cluster bacterium]|nr:HAMP domain-containing protein [SAR324 cluster bacterium]